MNFCTSFQTSAMKSNRGWFIMLFGGFIIIITLKLDNSSEVFYCACTFLALISVSDFMPVGENSYNKQTLSLYSFTTGFTDTMARENEWSHRSVCCLVGNKSPMAVPVTKEDFDYAYFHYIGFFDHFIPEPYLTLVLNQRRASACTPLSIPPPALPVWNSANYLTTYSFEMISWGDRDYHSLGTPSLEMWWRFRTHR